MLGYIVEKKSESDDLQNEFHPDNLTPHVGLRYTVRQLPTDTRWSFRVKAVNKLGVGEASEPTEPILIQSDEGKRSLCLNFKIMFKLLRLFKSREEFYGLT